MRDIYGIIGKPASIGAQLRAIAIVKLGSGTLVGCGQDIGLFIDSDGDQVSGHIWKLKADDNRANHGPLWQAMTGLLDRHPD